MPPDKMGRASRVIQRRSKPSDASRDEEISAGMDDEDASKAHQEKIQKARAEAISKGGRNQQTPWENVRKLSQTWDSLKDSKGRGKFR